MAYTPWLFLPHRWNILLMKESHKKKFAIEIGKMIKIAREKKNISQEELAFQCDIDRSYVGHLENGRHIPSSYMIALIASRLKISADHLIPKIN